MASETGTSPLASLPRWRTAAGTSTPVGWRSSTTAVVASMRSSTRSMVASRKAVWLTAVASDSAMWKRRTSVSYAPRGAVGGVGAMGAAVAGTSKGLKEKLSSARSRSTLLTFLARMTEGATSSPWPKRRTPPAPRSTISVAAFSTWLGWRTERVFSPREMVSPGCSSMPPVRGVPLTRLPLRLPRSSMRRASPSTTRRACRRETRSPPRTMSFSSARPRCVTPSGSS